jgi:hypothetical protein
MAESLVANVDATQARPCNEKRSRPFGVDASRSASISGRADRGADVADGICFRPAE